MSEIPATGRESGNQDRESAACLLEAEASLRRRQAVTDDAVSAWFLREIMPLEAILMHYLRLNWRNASDIPDLRQEVYARVFEAARERLPDNPRRFLLTSARNLLIDLVRREQVVPMETFGDFETLDIATEAPGPDQAIIQKEELRRLKAALERLPPRTREAMTLACFEGLSRGEIAERMGISQTRVSHHLADGVFLLGDLLRDGVMRRGAKS